MSEPEYIETRMISGEVIRTRVSGGPNPTLGPEYTIISKEDFDCPWCKKAEALFETVGLSFRTLSLGPNELSLVADDAQMDTVPIIYQSETLIGGYEDLDTHLKKIGY